LIVQVNTAGSNFDTLLAVFRGTSYPPIFVAGNDDVSV
jgi:hypothetical protein